MKIKVAKLKSVTGVRTELKFSLTKDEIGDKIELDLGSHPLEFEGSVENYDRIIKVSGKVKATLAGVCDRCGETADDLVVADFSENFTNLADKVPDEEESEGGTHLFEGDEINLLPYVEQAIFLNMPMKVLCSEDCKGLCPQCGQNLNIKECSCDTTPIDPRLAVLAELFKEVD